MAKKPHPVHMRKKDSLYLGKISTLDLYINRKGKPNSATNPRLRTRIYKSGKVYDRNKSKRELRMLNF